jgi:hypothetical protein
MMRRMTNGTTAAKRLLAGAILVPALLAVSGCGTSVAVTVAGYAADAMSRATTGKGLFDQAVSQVAARDCEMYRVLNGEPVCRDKATAVAAKASQRAPQSAMAIAAPDDMPLGDVRFDRSATRAFAPAPGERSWSRVVGAEEPVGPIVSDEVAPAAGPAAPEPTADMIIFAAAGSEERIETPER